MLIPTCYLRANNSVERDRQQAALVDSLRGFAATAAPHVNQTLGSTNEIQQC